MKPLKDLLFERGSEYTIHHNTFTSAVTEVLRMIKKKGYTVDEDDLFNTVTTGPGKPGVGRTNRYSLELYKNGKLQRKGAHFQVYGLESNRYELNFYIG